MTTARLRPPSAGRPARPDTARLTCSDSGEITVSNDTSGQPVLTICVPTWRDHASALLDTLIRMDGAERCALLVFDDGSRDAGLSERLTQYVSRFPGPAHLVSAPVNRGRSHARNRLFALAETDWILFLDADMQPDDGAFLNRYLSAIEENSDPALICGGFSLQHAVVCAETRLHAAQARTSECVTAVDRAEQPGRYVFSSNLLVHREVFDSVAFDTGFQGWGWEDVDWGLRVAELFDIRHIDNTATHLGLDRDANLIEKYARSTDNFARLVARHPDAMASTSLYRFARRMRCLPLRSAFATTCSCLAQLTWLPVSPRLLALKLFRAATYGGRL